MTGGILRDLSSAINRPTVEVLASGKVFLATLFSAKIGKSML